MTLFWCDSDGVSLDATIAQNFGNNTLCCLHEGATEDAADSARIAASYALRALEEPGGHWEDLTFELGSGRLCS